MYQETQAKMAGVQLGYSNPSAPPQPTRFSNCAGQLESRVAHISGLFDRVARVADRLSGPVPEEAQTGGKLQGSPTSTAALIEQALEHLDYVVRRAERTVERLEQL